MSEGRSERPISVMIVEDHSLVRAAIGDTLRKAGLEVIAEVGSAEEALAGLGAARPDVVLVDIELPGMNGIVLVRELVARLPESAVVILTGSSESTHLLTAMRAGASGYLTKDMSPQALARAVRGAVEGDLTMPRRLAASLVRDLVGSERRRARTPGASGPDALSMREREVLALVSEGMTDRAVSERLGISVRTVSHHLGRILAKLGVSSRAAAARAWEAGVIDSPEAASAEELSDELV